jgi:hypothetical protein|tara:strand:- start:2269 stop:3057 length:789 start_codon:yes stop_codon:yes gene_type:complete
MNEIQRMQYLSALDVDCYMPRLVLVNAPKAQLCPPVAVMISQTHTKADLAHTSPAVVNAHISTGLLNPVSDVLASLGVESLPPEKIVKQKTTVAEAEVEKPNQNTSIELVQPFSLSLQRIGSLLLVDSRSVDIALPTDRLLHSIAFALGYEHSQIAAAEIFSWPVTASEASVQTIDSVRLDLQAFLDGKLLTNSVEQLLLLGENAAKYFIDKDTLYTDCLYKKVELTSFSITAIVAPSLSHILAEAELKRKFWLAIRDSKKL